MEKKQSGRKVLWCFMRLASISKQLSRMSVDKDLRQVPADHYRLLAADLADIANTLSSFIDVVKRDGDDDLTDPSEEE